MVDQIEIARRVASIIGSGSAAAQAVEEYERREKGGEKPVCISSNGSWLVMPLSVYESAAR
jgi:hypothetical protein